VTKPRTGRQREDGQALVLFAGALTVIVLCVGLVVDGGYALSERRVAQNNADFAAMAGARVIAEWVTGDTVNGTDANVKTAITTAIAANGATALTFGASGSPQYVGSNGAIVPSAGSAASYVGNGTIPAGTAGVKVGASVGWQPFFLGIIGVNRWTASASATAKGGYATGAPGGNLFPVGIAQAFFQTYPFCSGVVSSDPTSPCYPQHLTPGNLNVPGGFGWLKFGCDGYGLGQSSNYYGSSEPTGCANNSPFLIKEIGPPSLTYGCCTEVGQGGPDRIGSLPGNKVDVSTACNYYINNDIIVTVPVWDTAGGQGSNAWYHIIGYAGFQLTACDGGKDIEGVWRKEFFLGPTSTTSGSSFTSPGIQLVR
jgi:Flp pilus assembly protein TadG